MNFQLNFRPFIAISPGEGGEVTKVMVGYGNRTLGPDLGVRTLVSGPGCPDLGVRISLLGPELSDRPETTSIVFLISSSPYFAPIV